MKKIQIRNSELDQKTWRCEMPTDLNRGGGGIVEKETSQKWRQAVSEKMININIKEYLIYI